MFCILIYAKGDISIVKVDNLGAEGTQIMGFFQEFLRFSNQTKICNLDIAHVWFKAVQIAFPLVVFRLHNLEFKENLYNLQCHKLEVNPWPTSFQIIDFFQEFYLNFKSNQIYKFELFPCRILSCTNDIFPSGC